MNFKVSLRREEMCALLVVRGELDMAAVEAFETGLNKLELEDLSTLAIDLRELTFCDSSGLHSLYLASRRADSAGRRIKLVGSPEHIKRLFHLTNIDSCFDFVDYLDFQSDCAPVQPDLRIAN